jgi:ArsR family transcriptional regulator
MQDLNKLMKALSDETRLRILNILLEKECCVCEIMQVMNISQSRASRNLRILQDAGLLKARRHGAWIFYSIDRDTANCYSASLVRLLKDTPVAGEIPARDRERLKHAVRTGPECVKRGER